MKAQHEKEIDRLYLQMYPMLFEYARSTLSNDALAAEAVQDTFLIACQKPEAVCESQNPQGWLVNTLKNVLSNTVRKQNIAKRILLNYFESTKNDISYSEDNIDLHLLYGRVADSEEFQLLKEMAIDRRSYEEMADSRGISIATCRKRVERAKKILRTKISK